MRAIFFIAISIILFLQSCAHRVGDDSAADNDSVFTVDYISRIAQLHPQEALSLLDSAERFEKMNVVDIDGLRAVVYNNALDKTDMSLIYARRVYDNPEVKTDTVSLLKSLMMLTALNLQESRYGEAIRYAGEGATVARQSNNRNALAYFLQMVGVARTETGSLDEGLDYLDRSVAIYRENVQHEPSWKTADDMLFGLMQKANQLLDHEQYERANAVAAECDEALTILGGCADLVDGVYDKRRAEIAGLHALACVGLGDLAGATKWYKQLCETDYGSTPQGGDLAVSYLIGTHQYEAALQRLNTEKELFAAGRDTLSHYYVNTLLANELRCLAGLGRTKEALAKSMQIKTMTDSLYARENVDHIAEQSVIYKTKDMEMQLVEQNRRMERQRLIFVIFVVVLVVLIAFVVVVRYFGKKIRLKNKKAVEMIEELADTHEARRIIRSEPAEMLADDADKAAFDAVDRTIVERKLYLQQGFSRDEAAQMSQMSPKHLSALFQQYADGFPNYINNLRLEHSVKLLRSKTKYTIEGISLECGFQSRQTFHRLFVERYGMTPAEFRRSANAK